MYTFEPPVIKTSTTKSRYTFAKVHVVELFKYSWRHFNCRVLRWVVPKTKKKTEKLCFPIKLQITQKSKKLNSLTTRSIKIHKRNKTPTDVPTNYLRDLQAIVGFFQCSDDQIDFFGNTKNRSFDKLIVLLKLNVIEKMADHVCWIQMGLLLTSRQNSGLLKVNVRCSTPTTYHRIWVDKISCFYGGGGFSVVLALAPWFSMSFLLQLHSITDKFCFFPFYSISFWRGKILGKVGTGSLKKLLIFSYNLLKWGEKIHLCNPENWENLFFYYFFRLFIIVMSRKRYILIHAGQLFICKFCEYLLSQFIACFFFGTSKQARLFVSFCLFKTLSIWPVTRLHFCI